MYNRESRRRDKGHEGHWRGPKSLQPAPASVASWWRAAALSRGGCGGPSACGAPMHEHRKRGGRGAVAGLRKQGAGWGSKRWPGQQQRRGACLPQPWPPPRPSLRAAAHHGSRADMRRGQGRTAGWGGCKWGPGHHLRDVWRAAEQGGAPTRPGAFENIALPPRRQRRQQRRSRRETDAAARRAPPFGSRGRGAERPGAWPAAQARLTAGAAAPASAAAPCASSRRAASSAAACCASSGAARALASSASRRAPRP
jgi:hypothetical protein